MNENTNGLIRQDIPKKAMLSDYSDKDIAAIQDAINSRPRKTLGDLTPREVFIDGTGGVGGSATDVAFGLDLRGTREAWLRSRGGSIGVDAALSR